MSTSYPNGGNLNGTPNAPPYNSSGQPYHEQFSGAYSPMDQYNQCLFPSNSNAFQNAGSEPISNGPPGSVGQRRAPENQGNSGKPPLPSYDSKTSHNGYMGYSPSSRGNVPPHGMSPGMLSPGGIQPMPNGIGAMNGMPQMNNQSINGPLSSGNHGLNHINGNPMNANGMSHMNGPHMGGNFPGNGPQQFMGDPYNQRMNMSQQNSVPQQSQQYSQNHQRQNQNMHMSPHMPGPQHSMQAHNQMMNPSQPIPPQQPLHHQIPQGQKPQSMMPPQMMNQNAIRNGQQQSSSNGMQNMSMGSTNPMNHMNIPQNSPANMAQHMMHRQNSSNQMQLPNNPPHNNMPPPQMPAPNSKINPGPHQQHGMQNHMQQQQQQQHQQFQQQSQNLQQSSIGRQTSSNANDEDIPPPTPGTPYTGVTHFDLPAALVHLREQFRKINPSVEYYYGRVKQRLRLPYPSGTKSADPSEPPTFGFLKDNKYYEERYQRNPGHIPPAKVSNRVQPPSLPHSLPQMQPPLLNRSQSMQPMLMSPSFQQAGQPPAKKARSASEAIDDPSFNMCGPNSNPSGMFSKSRTPGSYSEPSPINQFGMPSTSMQGYPPQHQMQQQPQQQSRPPNSMGAQPNTMGAPPNSIGAPTNPVGAQPNLQQRPGNNYMMGQIGMGSDNRGMGYGMGIPNANMHGGMRPNMRAPDYAMPIPAEAICQRCSRQIPPGSPSLKCMYNECKNTYHKECTGLSPNAYNALEMESPMARWVCPICEPIIKAREAQNNQFNP